MSRKTVLVAGASGVVGYAAMKRFVAAGDDVIALSRRPPIDTDGARFIAVDLQDREASRAAIAALGATTHLVYAALFEKPGLIAGWFEDDQIDTNDRMFRNLLDPLLAAAPQLEHITLLQGTKAYGLRRPTPVAARENIDEAHDEPNFYWRHESYLRERQRDASWTFTILRPQIIYGLSIGSAMNVIPALGVYGAVLKARGEPLHFPGASYGAVQEAVDADLLANVIAWAMHDPHARANEIFNVTNGDVYSWRSVWPDIARALDMEVGEDRPLSFATSASGWADEWEALRSQHQLLSPPLRAFVGESFHYADMLLNFGGQRRIIETLGGQRRIIDTRGAEHQEPPRPPSLLSALKLRRAGFHDVMDTHEMFAKWLRILQRRNLIPRV